MSDLREYKCPACGGAIEFDSKSQKMKCPYCDTEFELETLRDYIDWKKNGISRVFTARNGRRALECLEENMADIVITDIQMPGMDGMETARILRQKNERMVLIFVTAVEEYVFQAFDVAAFHYLVKPFSDEKFEEVVKRAVRSIEKYSENQSDEKYMMVQSGGSHMKVFLKDIVYAEVYNRKVIIHTRDTNIEYYGKLQELSEIAGADFFRTHRAYLVHFKYVQKYDANCVTLENGTAMIAKQNYPEFVKQYLKYNQRKGSRIG